MSPPPPPPPVLTVAQLLELPDTARERVMDMLGPSWCAELRLASRALSDLVTASALRTAVLECPRLVVPTQLLRLARRFSRQVTTVIIRRGDTSFFKPDLPFLLSKVPAGAWPCVSRVAVGADDNHLDARSLAEILRICPSLRDAGGVAFGHGSAAATATQLARCAGTLESLEASLAATAAGAHRFTVSESVTKRDHAVAAAALRGLTALRRLALSAGAGVAEEAQLGLLGAAASLPALRELRLVGRGTRSIEFSLGVLPQGGELGGVTRLEMRVLSATRFASIVRAVAACCPNVAALRLESSCFHFTPPGGEGGVKAAPAPAVEASDGESGEEESGEEDPEEEPAPAAAKEPPAPAAVADEPPAPAAAAAEALLPRLEALEVIDCTLHDERGGKPRPGGPAPTDAAAATLEAVAPRLRSLLVQGTQGKQPLHYPGFCVHSGLQELSIIDTGAGAYHSHVEPKDSFARSLASEFPSVSKLALRLGTPGRGPFEYRYLRQQQVAPAAAPPRPENGLRGLALEGDEVEALRDLRAYAAGWGALRSLSLDAAGMDARAGMVLGVLSVSPAAARLERVELRASGLGTPAAAALALACLHVFPLLRELVVRVDVERRLGGNAGSAHCEGERRLTDGTLRALVGPLPDRGGQQGGGGGAASGAAAAAAAGPSALLAVSVSLQVPRGALGPGGVSWAYLQELAAAKHGLAVEVV